ncbi:MAG TPA: PepSY-associated TM helix domain-containing protein [Longimicrobiaceae bacterium]|nr:PepSY-associated TM helix domain-containing protein [Longimicrobiaceae bacterium]
MHPPVHTHPAPPRRARRARSRAWARWMFYSHLWLGIATTGIVLIVCATGILLNHKRELGLMPDVPNDPARPFAEALPLPELARRAESAVAPAVAATGIDRMDVRPGDGLVKVRFDDRAVHEVTLDLASGRILHVGERNDVFLEKLHSGEIFGDGWVLLSDLAAVAMAVLLVSGYWLWLYPRAHG